MLAVDAPFLQSKPYNNLLLQPLLGGGQVGGGLLGWRRNLHPIILPPLHRDPVLCRLARDNWGLNPFYICYIFSLFIESVSLVPQIGSSGSQSSRDRRRPCPRSPSWSFPLRACAASGRGSPENGGTCNRRTWLWWKVRWGSDIGPCFSEKWDNSKNVFFLLKKVFFCPRNKGNYVTASFRSVEYGWLSGPGVIKVAVWNLSERLSKHFGLCFGGGFGENKVQKLVVW